MANLPEPKQQMLAELNRHDPTLAGRKVLVVDDDVRNIFALTSVLEGHNMKVLHAENGQQGIDLLKATPDIDAVLMDIMMPEMDGYEAIAAIRQLDEFKELPIIALTAKAMKADRDRCLEVGASDYISKPLDLDQLFFLVACLALSPSGEERSRETLGKRDSDDNLKRRSKFCWLMTAQLICWRWMPFCKRPTGTSQGASGDDALRYLLDCEVAVILLDVYMPGIDGLQTAELIRSRERSKDTPIIFLTADAMAIDILAADTGWAPLITSSNRSSQRSCVQRSLFLSSCSRRPARSNGRHSCCTKKTCSSKMRIWRGSTY